MQKQVQGQGQGQGQDWGLLEILHNMKKRYSVMFFFGLTGSSFYTEVMKEKGETSGRGWAI